MTGRSQSPSRRTFLDPVVWVVYAAILSFGIPWYWTGDGEAATLGFPVWTLVSLASCVALAGWTAWLLWRRWPLEEHEPEARNARKGTRSNKPVNPTP